MTKQMNELSEMAAALFPCCESDSTRPWGWLPVVRHGRMWALRGSTIVGLPLPTAAGVGLTESGVMIPAGAKRPDGSHELENGVPRQRLEAAALRAIKAAARSTESWELSPGMSAGTVRIPEPERFVGSGISYDATATFLSVSPAVLADVGKALERLIGATSIQLVASAGSGTALPSWHIFARETRIEGVPPVFGFEFAPSKDGFRWVGVVAPVDVGGVDVGAMESLICEKVPRRKVPKPAKAAPEKSTRSKAKADGDVAIVSGAPDGVLGMHWDDNPDA